MLSRRRFLQLATQFTAASAALTALPRGFAFADSVHPGADAGRGIEPDAPPAPLGRVTMFGADIYAAPKSSAKSLRRAPRDAVLTLSGQLAGEAVWPHNDTWYALADGGYVYSPLVQPVREALNEPEPRLAAGRFWGEITMPQTDARWTPDAAARSGGRLYYSAVFEVIGARQAADETWWYQLEHGVSHSPGPWIQAAHLRRFDPVADLAPISPAAQDKRIEVNIAAQTMTAFESGKVVMTSRVASGRGKNFTPRGSYKVFRKAPGQRMIGGEGNDYYDLPGVPFPTYFTARGIALHGAYWHNDFGTVRSHGCVNLPSEVARWIWRWTTPVAPLEAADIYFRGVSGTPVTVI